MKKQRVDGVALHPIIEEKIVLPSTHWSDKGQTLDSPKIQSAMSTRRGVSSLALFITKSPSAYSPYKHSLDDLSTRISQESTEMLLIQKMVIEVGTL